MWLMLLFTLNLSASFKSYIIGSYQTLSDIYFDLKYIPKVVDVYIHIAFQRQFQTLQTSYQISGEIYVDVKYIISPRTTSSNAQLGIRASNSEQR